MYYIHTMTTILRYIRTFVATAYFNQFIRPNYSIINQCKYRRNRRANAKDASCNVNNGIVNYDQSIEWSIMTNPGTNSIIPER